VAIVDYSNKMRGINTVNLIGKSDSFRTSVALKPTKVYLVNVRKVISFINGAALTLVAKQALHSKGAAWAKHEIWSHS
jgi:hypothetical protein